MKKMLLIFLLMGNFLYAAVGCDLNDPDRDVKKLFPNYTGYKTIYFSIDKYPDAEKIYQNIQTKLGDKFNGIYETIDVPYTVYEIYKNKEKIGYIHGVNQKGQYGGIQVFLALNMEKTITGFYIQKLTSKYGKNFRSDAFYNQFIGLNLNNFDISKIKNPVPEAEQDFKATLRATKKNLILIDQFE